MKNLSRLLSLILFLALFVGISVFAETTAKPPTEKAVVLATVNIEGAKIISQKNNIFDISFSLTNREGLQTGVKYGIKLVKDNQFMVDEKIYDESLTLNPNTILNKEITYTAPSLLNGEYSLIITSNNTSGFPFAISNLGKVTLKATTTGIEILPETCYLQIVNEKNSPKYDLVQGIDIKQEENLKLTCSVMNSSKSDILATPTYETHYRSTFGDIVSQTGGDTTPVSFKASEKKDISLILPKATTPQSYNIKLTLGNKDNKSNPVYIEYVLDGTSVTIQKVSLDKDYYAKGDQALISFVYTPSPDSPVITGTVKISDGNGKSCADTQTKDLTKQTSINIDMPVSITSSCVDPKIIVTITDDKGTVLDQKEFSVKSTSAPQTQSNSSIFYIIILVALLFIIIFYIFMKKKKTPPSTPTEDGQNPPTNTIPMSVIFPFLLIITLFGFIPLTKVSADTVAVGVQTAVVNIDRGSGGTYSKGGPIVATGSLSTYDGNITATTNVGGLQIFPGIGSGTIYAPTTGGTQYATFYLYAYQRTDIITINPTYTPCIYVSPNFCSLQYYNYYCYVGGVYRACNSSDTGQKFTYVPGGQTSSKIYSTVNYGIPFNVLDNPVVTVTADSTNIPYNTGTTIHWSATNNPYSCIRADTGAELIGTSSFPTGNLTATKTFTITCYN